MDGGRFDAIARATAAASRRGALRLLTGGALGVLLTRFGVQEVGAEHEGCLHVGVHCNPKRPGRCCSGSCPKGKKKCRCTVDVCPPPESASCEASCSTKFTCGFRPTGGTATCDACMENAICTDNGQCVGTPKSCPGGECCNGACESDLGEPCPGQGGCAGTKVCTAQGKECQCPPPPTLVSVSVSPDPVLIGSPSLGTVTLDAPAQGNTAVTLSIRDTDAGAASVPGTATVASGQTNATFDVTGLAPKEQVELSAILGADTVKTTFAVQNPV